jgi:hypothetical protein
LISQETKMTKKIKNNLIKIHKILVRMFKNKNNDSDSKRQNLPTPKAEQINFDVQKLELDY